MLAKTSPLCNVGVTFSKCKIWSFFLAIIQYFGFKNGLIICLPPAGDIYCFSLRVCPSVRPFVCNAFLSEPYLQELFVQKKMQKKKCKNNISTEVVQRKIKIQFCQIFWKFWPKKKHFLNLRFVHARSR